jgi:ankyrin repeat protein
MAIVERRKNEEYNRLRNVMEDGDHERLIHLLNSGVNPNYHPIGDRTPLELAIRWHDEDAVCILLQKGADLGYQNSHGDTPLMFAVNQEYPDLAIVRLLVKSGADPNISNERDQTAYTVLESNEEFLNHEDFEYLLEILDSYESYEPIKEPDPDFY